MAYKIHQSDIENVVYCDMGNIVESILQGDRDLVARFGVPEALAGKGIGNQDRSLEEPVWAAIFDKEGKKVETVAKTWQRLAKDEGWEVAEGVDVEAAMYFGVFAQVHDRFGWGD